MSNKKTESIMTKSSNNKMLTLAQANELLSTLKDRFEKNMKRHQDLSWVDI